MKAPFEHDRCTVVEIKFDDKSFSTLSKVSSDLRLRGNNEMRTIKAI